jgi:hypothetical protein
MPTPLMARSLFRRTTVREARSIGGYRLTAIARTCEQARAFVRMLVSRQEMTGVARSWAQQHQVHDILRYSRSSSEAGTENGEYTRLLTMSRTL